MEQTRNHIISDWMFSLGLSANDIIIYAMIYGATQDGQSYFGESTRSIASRMRIERKTVLNTLARLEEGGLIRKFIYDNNGSKQCYYQAVLTKIPSESPSHDESKPTDFNLSFIKSGKIRAAVKEWIDWKARVGEPYITLTEIRKFFNVLMKLSDKNEENAVALIEYAIGNTWHSIHEVREPKLIKPKEGDKVLVGDELTEYIRKVEAEMIAEQQKNKKA